MIKVSNIEFSVVLLINPIFFEEKIIYGKNDDNLNRKNHIGEK